MRMTPRARSDDDLKTYRTSEKWPSVSLYCCRACALDASIWALLAGLRDRRSDMVVVRGERWILAHRFRTVILTGACHTQLEKTLSL